eukprot:7736520-Alexandrium_andersonii.AAC.1
MATPRASVASMLTATKSRRTNKKAKRTAAETRPLSARAATNSRTETGTGTSHAATTSHPECVATG